jgi:outer membrane lipoprotein carrier protein
MTGRTRGRRAFLRLLAIIAVLPAPSGAGGLPSARAELDRFLAEVKSFHARFEQTLFDEYGEPLESSRGEVDIARPGRFNWVYAQPYRQRLVSDGKTLWVYDADLEQVTINEVDAGSADSPGRLLGDDVDVDAGFTVTELPAKAGNAWLRLTPKAADRQFNEIELGLRDGTVVAMRLKDNLGQVTEIAFSDIARNVALEPDRFRFDAPAGVDIIRGTGS